MVTRANGETEQAAPFSFGGFCCSATGAAHLRTETPVQDSVLIEKHNSFTIACACDGHGGSDYIRSKRGSELACIAAAQCLKNSQFIEAMRLAETPRREEELILQLKKSIIFTWNELVREDVKANPFTGIELEPCTEALRQSLICSENLEIAYGTTLICAIAASSFFLALQIGDGMLLFMNESKEIFAPMPEDERCFLNYTSSICTENALECTRHYLTRELPKAVFLATDGVDKSFAEFQKLCEFYSLLFSSIEEKGEETAFSELEDFLPRLSKNGSGDDVSIAVLFRK